MKKNNSELRIVVCSGGTGGHTYPACALYSMLENQQVDVTLITDERGNVFCSNICKKIILKTVRFSMKSIFSMSFDLFRVFIKFFKKWITNCPDVIVGFGGILTIIPIIVGKFFGAKVVLYEQNSIVGKTNRLLSCIANLKLSTFDIDDTWTKLSPVVRAEFITNSKSTQYSYVGKMRILVIGGSQGAKSFSNIIPEALKLLSVEELKNIEIIQQIDEIGNQKLLEQYKKLSVTAELLSFVNNVADVMRNSQLVICRSGASTLAELSAIGCPAILIPYPLSSDNHQLQNALYYKKKNAVWIIEENNNSSLELSLLISKFLYNRDLLKTASVNIFNASIAEAKSEDEFLKLIKNVC